jgi:hypothetical protein
VHRTPEGARSSGYADRASRSASAVSPRLRALTWCTSASSYSAGRMPPPDPRRPRLGWRRERLGVALRFDYRLPVSLRPLPSSRSSLPDDTKVHARLPGSFPIASFSAAVCSATHAYHAERKRFYSRSPDISPFPSTSYPISFRSPVSSTTYSSSPSSCVPSFAAGEIQ